MGTFSNRGATRPFISLVGAGPGDPDLLTLKAYKRIQAAEVVLYDRLVSEDIMALVPATAQKVFVGKKCGKHFATQDTIHDLLLKFAHAGKRIVRLKGGDPFLFGRGGEEMQSLQVEGYNVEVVPGITAGLGCTAYSGIPLTHRDFAQSALFITAHHQDGKAYLDLPAPLPKNQTMAVYMGVKTMHHIMDDAMNKGLPADWPVAVIEKGTTKDQRVVLGTVGTIADICVKEQVQSPALTVIGQVVTLHEAWGVSAELSAAVA